MTDYAHHPDFVSDVQKQVDEFAARIDEGLQWVSDQWEKCIMDSNWGWLSPGPKAAYEYAKSKCEEKMQELVVAFQDGVKEIWKAVRTVTGDPFTLMQMNQAYIDAAGALRDEKIVMRRLKTSVAGDWEGSAFTAYSSMIDEQLAAVGGVDSGLVKAATACAQGALQINSIWTDIVNAILEYAGKVVSAIKDGTDAGQWVTLDLGPALKIILDAVLAAGKLAVKLETYWADNATVKTSMWRELNSGLEGLNANNEWPGIAYYSGEMDDQGNWKNK